MYERNPKRMRYGALMDRDIMLEQVLEYFIENYSGEMNEIDEEFKHNFNLKSDFFINH